MILKPTSEDYKVIGYYLGKIIIGLGLLMMIPLVIAAAYSELEPVVDYLLSISVALFLGVLLTGACHTNKDIAAGNAMCIAALSWLVAMVISAIPLYLSGHYASYLDACFETMSGFATTGLSLTNDMDSMAHAHIFWRHFTMFIGGQGIVVIALTFLFRGTAGAFRIYIGEARDEKILPNVIHTARFIWLVSIVYMVLGTIALSASAIIGGLSPGKAIFDSVCIFMAAWDTGGFTPQSQSILFYHNLSFEIITVVIMLLGSMNFALHYVVWTGNRRELYKNIEVITLFISVVVTLSITAVGFFGHDIYGGAAAFFRKVFYQLISGHTGTGYSTIYPGQFVNEWGPLAMLGVTIAMAIGGCMCSTTGAIKVLRLGILYKALRQDIKKVLLPESAVVVQKFHHIKDVILENKHVRMSAIILLSYLGLYMLGTVVAMLCGYSLSEAAFESVSAAANVGLSCGITKPSMPLVLKITYMFQMWAGRLEFIAIFALGGMIVAALKGKR
ncbi:MAG: TrkH family potassium uptake protein [Candidatus Omnitrophica bacterium]|nr:TrkH family potassium uptake protein [Candidatus Omnitrophota bacterium]MBU0895043.1 TrkH family potassium uptake protein [Candidatus Omnitrophota bacterium]MBU1808485.1 TrkH family potassium uptake protein [Candidatus Omnitrophota bacterium]